MFKLSLELVIGRCTARINMNTGTCQGTHTQEIKPDAFTIAILGCLWLSLLYLELIAFSPSCDTNSPNPSVIILLLV